MYMYMSISNSINSCKTPSCISNFFFFCLVCGARRRAGGGNEDTVLRTVWVFLTSIVSSIVYLIG